MKTTTLTVLYNIVKGVNDRKDLMNLSKVKAWQLNYHLNYLKGQDYIDKRNSKVYLKNNPKSILLRDIVNKYDIRTLLRDSNEEIFATLIKPMAIDDLQKETKLSLATIYKSLAELQSIGIIKRENDSVSLHSQPGNPTYLLAQILSTERKRDNVKHEEFVEIIYEDNSTILKRVPKGKKTNGDLTGFSLFSEYGIQYHTAHDYFVEQVSELTLEEVLMHAILAAGKSYDQNGITMSILFYIENRDKMDLLNIKKIARKLGLVNIWSDIENYLRNNPVINQGLFSPKIEFQEKAKLYHISHKLYSLPTVYPDLFEEISTMITRDTTIYLIGGENMRIKGLKAATKDCDIVVDTVDDMNVVTSALEKMDYLSSDEKKLSKNDARVQPFQKFSKADRSDVEIFFNIIVRKFYLSQRMKERSKSDERIFGRSHKLKLRLLANEDIFLLKAITDREGDLYDMVKLIQTGNFDWNIVLEELQKQEKETGNHFSTNVMDSIDDLVKQTNIKPPIYKKLLQRSIDENIFKLIVKKKGMHMDEVISILKGQDISEKLIRNRIDSLERKRLLRKSDLDKRSFLRPRKSQVLKFQTARDPIDERYLVNVDIVNEYINRFLLKLGLSELADRTFKISTKICASPNFISNRPRNLAAAIISVTARLERWNKSRKTIAEVAGVSEPSVTLLSRKIIRELSKSTEDTKLNSSSTSTTTMPSNVLK